MQPCVQRWQSQQHSWSTGGLTSRRAPRIPATTNSTVLTHSFHKGHLAFLPINLLQKPNGVIYPLIFYQKGGAGLNICIEEGIQIVSPLKWITGLLVLTISLCQEVLSKRWGYCLQLIWNMNNNIPRHSVCIILHKGFE